MPSTSKKLLRLTPYAWAKLLYLRDLGNTEVGGFGISSADDLLLVEDICLIKQYCTEVTVRFDDQAVADFFDAKVQVLSEEIEHHVEEEEKELFPQVRKADLDLKELGEQLATRKKELMKEYKASGVPEPELQTMDEVSI